MRVTLPLTNEVHAQKYWGWRLGGVRVESIMLTLGELVSGNETYFASVDKFLDLGSESV